MSKLSKGIVLFIIFILLLFQGCETEQQLESGRIDVAVTILPFADFVKRIGGERVDVTVMIPPGVSPADFEPEIRNMKALQNADVYFKVGGTFSVERNFLERSFHPEYKAEIIDCSEDVVIMNSDHHIWLGIEEVKIIGRHIAEGLSELSPEDSAYFIGNYRNFIAQIDTIDARNKALIAESGVKKFLVYHPAYTYLAEHYGLRQLYVEHEHKTPKGNELAETIELAREEGVKRVFIQPQFDKSAIRVISEELDAEIETLNPLPEDYLEFLEDFGRKISG